MKKIKMLIAMFFTLVLVTGCGMKENFDIKISKDKKVDFSLKVVMDNEMIDSIIAMSDQNVSVDSESGDIKEYTDQERWDFLLNESCDTDSEEYTCEKFEEDGYKGFIIKLKTMDIDSLVGTEDRINLADFEGDTPTSFFKKDGDVYSSNFGFNSEGNTEMSDYSSELDFFTFLFEVSLPNKSISNNATTVSDDGLKLTWDLSKESKKDIDFSFKFEESSDSNNTNTVEPTTGSNDSNMLISTKTNDANYKKYILYGVIGLVALIIISILIIIFANAASKNKNNNVDTEASKLFHTPSAITNDGVNEKNSETPVPVSEEPVQETKEESNNQPTEETNDDKQE